MAYDEREDEREAKEAMETIVMTDDEGQEIEFFVINGAEKDGVRYLLVVRSCDYDKEEPDAYIIKEVGDDGEELAFEFVEDEGEYAAAVVLMSEEDNDYELKV